MPPASTSAAPLAHRPAWLLWLMALPMGLLANGMVNGLENLPDAFLTLMGWLAEPSRLQRLLAALVSNFLVPGLLAFMLLRLTPLGRWLAPNRLAVGGLVLAHGLVMFVVLHGLYQTSMNEPPCFIGPARAIVGPATAAALGFGLGAVVLSTIWHRLVRDKQRALSFGRRMWCEYLG